VSCFAGAAIAQPAWFDQSQAQRRIASIAAAREVPGISVAVRSLNDSGVGAAAAGVLRISTGEAVTTENRFHVGSNSKAFTATIAARAVDAGQISWDTTIAEAFADEPAIDPSYAQVTLRQLLTHHGGAPAFPDVDSWLPLNALSGTPAQQRSTFARSVLSSPRAVAPGADIDTRYSNAGISIAAAMVEHATGVSWEDSIQQVFNEQMGLNVQIGFPGRNDGSSQAYGHLLIDGVTSEFGPDYVLPSAIAPAGDLSMSMPDLAEFGIQHLRALSGASNTLGLSAASVLALHDDTFLGGPYAMGWYPIDEPGLELYGFGHSGSTSVFNSILVVDTVNGYSIAVGTNGYTGTLDAFDLTPMLLDAVVATRASVVPSPSSAALPALGLSSAVRRRRR
jgi:CubicO group peptidase (beta-lactamase class C family)